MIDSLPSDLMIMILLKLPAKTLLRCLSVCTEWKTLIQGQTFIDAHLSRQRGDLILVRRRTCVEGREKESYSIHCDDETFSQYANYEFPLQKLGTCYRVVGSCNGVICITSDQLSKGSEDTYLWNPIIRKCVKLPCPRVTYHSHGRFDHELGFGFDPTTDDYKVVRIVCMENMDDAPLEVDIYSLSSKSWRNVSHLALGLGFRIFERQGSGEREHHGFRIFEWRGCRKREHHGFRIFESQGCGEREHQVYLNGVLHWVGYQENPMRYVIIAFHVGDEEFRCFEPPTIAESDFFWYKALKPTVIQNTFSLVHYTKGRCSIWMMKDYGDTSSWVKKKDINVADFVDRVIGFRKKGELLIEMYDGLYSFVPGVKEVEIVDDSYIHIGSIFLKYTFHSESFTESLVLIGMKSCAEFG